MLAITDAEFERVKNMVYAKTGIALRPSKRALVMARLSPRVEKYSMKGYGEYLDFISASGHEELEVFINVMTTNETFFFRNGEQFTFLRETVLPELKSKKKSELIEVWSAACSSGEEPYSIAITMHDFFKTTPDRDFSVYATDINTQILEEARAGLYGERSLRETSRDIRNKYFIEKTVGAAKTYEVADRIKKYVKFSQHNLKNVFLKRNLDFVFLRNVFIYFDREVKQHVIQLMEDNVKPGGYLFLSLSETLMDVQSSFRLLHSSIYKKVT